MEWTGYDVFDPEVDRPLAEVSRAEARRHFDKLMAEKDERAAALRDLVRRDAGIEPGGDPDAWLTQVEAWLRDRVEAHPTHESMLVEEWYSVVNDLALVLGDLAIEDSPWLSWELCTGGRRNVAFQRPVLMGFRVPNRSYLYDLDRVLGGFALALAAGEDEPAPFLTWLRATLARQAVGDMAGVPR